MKKKIKFFEYYLDFLFTLTFKDLRIIYKKTFLGIGWIIIEPLFQVLVMGSVFSYFIKIEDYNVFLLSGLLPWNFFSNSISKACNSYITERHLLKKTYFPLEAIPLSKVVLELFKLLISLAILLAYLFLLPKSYKFNLINFFISILFLVIFTINCSLILSIIQVKFRGTKLIVETVIKLWFYATPILYSLTKLSKDLTFLLLLNPLTIIIQLMHNAFFENYQLTSQTYLTNILTIFFLTIFAIFLFNNVKKTIPDLV